MNFLKKVLIIVFLLFCSINYAQTNQITVAVAANVQFAMQELKQEFKNESGINTVVIIGSSGQLTAQIKQGAPYDVFISADMKYPLNLFKNNFAVDSPRVYALGTLVIWTMKKEIKLTDNLNELLDDNIQKIASANPKIAPYGEAAIEALKYFGIYNNIKNKLVFGESIAPTNQFIISGAADIGFTAKSVVMSPAMKGKGIWKEVNPISYKPIQQGCVILKYGFVNNKTKAEKFYKFLFSDNAKKILLKYGYQVSEDK
jgi:molybdate transport system substrate-binding protein